MQIIGFSATHISDLTSIPEINKSGNPTLQAKVEVDSAFIIIFMLFNGNKKNPVKSTFCIA
jgi:hypothetical protein